MTNSLAASLSPYLRQHADNPVDWREWSPAAFAEAIERDVPVLLSVGYAACHWCHVMAHESFEDRLVAAELNENFVNIKVDREERPDIDAVYMAATQALTGQGGWPMTVFLTPEGAPLYAGTYFPKDQFLAVIRAITSVWRDDREKAESTGQTIVEALSGRQLAHTAVEWDAAMLDSAVDRVRHDVDTARGGFGGAPKFPPSMTLEHLLRHHARTGSAEALAMVRRTCDVMARGGMYDQLEGGFARYSVDANWIVPHFEKMLYDNAQLLRVYAHLARIDGGLAPRVARETGDFLLAHLRTDEGGFASSLDADTRGVEGETYVWSQAELVEVLGEQDGARAAQLLDVTAHGTFEAGTSTLQLRRDPEQIWSSSELGMAPAQWWAGIRATLLHARRRRAQPERDSKVVTAWNGLAIAALADAGRVLERPDWVKAAEAAAQFLVRNHVVEGRLRRASLEGHVSAALAGADDYGNLAEGLLVLHQATGAPYWLTRGCELLDTATELFFEDRQVYDSGADAEALFMRPSSTGDNAEPSGASALASAFTMAFALTGRTEYRERAYQGLAQLSAVAQQAPRFAGWALATAEALAAGPLQVAVVMPGEPADADAAMARVSEFERAVWLSTSAGMVRVIGTADAPGVPLLAQRTAVRDDVTAYVCRGFVCDSPVVDAQELASRLA